jgi:hypothetical protein
MSTPSKPPSTVEDLADEALAGWEGVFGPQQRAVLRTVLVDLFATHPTMAALAEERLVESRVPLDDSGLGVKLPGPVTDALRGAGKKRAG